MEHCCEMKWTCVTLEDAVCGWMWHYNITTHRFLVGFGGTVADVRLGQSFGCMIRLMCGIYCLATRMCMS